MPVVVEMSLSVLGYGLTENFKRVVLKNSYEYTKIMMNLYLPKQTTRIAAISTFCKLIFQAFLCLQIVYVLCNKQIVYNIFFSGWLYII